MESYKIDGYEDEANEGGVRALLIGRSVSVDGTTLYLDNGTELEIVPNEGCGGCTAGWFEIDELNSVDNAITSVEFEDEKEQIYRIFVYAENVRMKLLEVSGYDNGFYGTGYYVNVKRKS